MAATVLTPTRAIPLRSCAVRAPAKINLTLEVLGRRSDGYHDIRSLVIGAGMYDELRCSQASTRGVAFQCSDRTLGDRTNLVVRAAELLADAEGLVPSIAIELDKQIPVGAGLGGGSSDAAACLRACERLWNARVPVERLAAMGAALGSDVPLFFGLPAAVISGRGEVVRPAALRWQGYALLVLPGVHVSTAEVYAAWRPEDSAGIPPADRAGICECTTADEVTALAVNHLEAAVFRVAPRIRRLHETIGNAKIGRARVSGSGSAMYVLFDEAQSAERAALTIGQRLDGVRTAIVPAPVGEVPVECHE